MRLFRMGTDTIGHKREAQRAAMRVPSPGRVAMYLRRCEAMLALSEEYGAEGAHRDRPAKDGAAVPEISGLLPRESISAWL